jgi:hypothetical protein
MKKFFTLLLATNIHYDMPQTSNSLHNTFRVNGRATGFSTNGTWMEIRNLVVQVQGEDHPGHQQIQQAAVTTLN